SAGGRLRALARPELVFNYLGQVDRGAVASPLVSLPEEIGGATSPRSTRHHALEVDCQIASGILKAQWTYSYTLHRDETVQGLADTFLQKLRAILDHCPNPIVERYTPSDFILPDLKQQQLDRLAR